MYIKSQTRADARGLVGAVLVGSITGLALGGVYLAGGLAQSASTHARVARLADGASGSFSDAALVSAATRMDPGALAVAKRHDPYLFAALDQRDRQSQQLAARLEGAGAANLRPGQTGRTGPLMLRASFGSAFNVGGASPFQFGSALESSRELECLADAVYYEARGETPSGQAAVAQVVMNRVKHPAFPKSVCAVVFQGAGRKGCQFSFACDGSMRKRREVLAWNRARDVATRAMAGAARVEVGAATHFHTTAVSPIWAPHMLRVASVGAHVFYKFAPYRLRTAPAAAPAVQQALLTGGSGPIPDLRIEASVEKAIEASLEAASPTAAAAEPKARAATGAATPVVAEEARLTPIQPTAAAS